MLRARTTHWFDLITTRVDFTSVMNALAASGAVELEARALDDTHPVLPRLDEFFQRFAQIEKRYATYWPDVGGKLTSPLDDPDAVLARAFETLETWKADADPIIAKLQRLQSGASDLRRLRHLFSELEGGLPVVNAQPEAGTPRIAQVIYFLQGQSGYETEIEDTLISVVPSAEGTFVIAVATPDGIAKTDAAMHAANATRMILPAELPTDPTEQSAFLGTALAQNTKARAQAEARIAEISAFYGLEDLLSKITILRWLNENRDEFQATDHTIRVTGWTRPGEDAALRAALDATGANYVLGIAAEDASDAAPLVLSNPAWLRPFEFFPRMLGVPARGEADPSILTALLAPLMFGYMFGDLGQGAVLVLIGYALRNTMPLLRLLIPGGIAAMVFGVLFGSVFSREDVIPALWLHPLNEPITVLAVALGMGIAFLLLGIVLDALQAAWRNRLAAWVLAHAGIIVTYLSLLVTVWFPAFVWGVPIGLTLTVLGARDGSGAGWTPMAVVGALGEYVEALMRLFVSSVSFSRVGAFALAHAGLSTAIVGIADASGGMAYWVILLLGNILIIALEGLVTGIQTTRLILFEFFTRFFTASGREFRPLAPPPPLSKLNEGRTS